nr:hypothetical protein [Tanacetum cinerariifolium]
MGKAPVKNVKNIAISPASLILEDFDPPVSDHELPFHKEVPGSETLLLFSSKNEEKVFKPEILTSKGVRSSLLPELSHRGPKAFKIIKILESPMEIFPCSFGEYIRNLDVPCKEIAKPITPLLESASKEDSDLEQAQRDKDMQNNLALVAKYFKKIYKPTNNNLKTSSNSKNKNVDTTLRYKNDNQTGQFRNQRTVTVAGARETIDQNAEDECAALANLIANLKLDVDENKKIQKQLKRANASLAHELKECQSILAETSKTLRESNSIRDSRLVALQNKQTEFERYKALNDRTVDYDKLELVAKVSINTSTSGISPNVAELKDMVKALLIDKKSQNQAPATVKAAEESCVTCGGAHSYQNCPATDGNVYRDNIQEFISQPSAVNYNQGNTSYRPPMMSNQIRPPSFPPIPNNQNV